MVRNVRTKASGAELAVRAERRAKRVAKAPAKVLDLTPLAPGEVALDTGELVRVPLPKVTQWARDVVGEDIRYAVKGWFARGFVSSIYSPRDQGKTTVALAIMADLSNGRLFGRPHPKIRILFNTREDTLKAVIKPRLEAAGADFGAPDDPHPLLAISSEPWEFPRDLGLLEERLQIAKEGEAPYDMIILDSVAAHLVRLNSIQPMTEAMTGLIKLADQFDLAVVMIGHLTKSKGSTVESAIYGASVLQNLSKGLFVFGPVPLDPDPEVSDDPLASEPKSDVPEDEQDPSDPRFALACERTGWGARPATVLFTRETIDVPGRNYEEEKARLVFAGTSDLTAWQIKEFSKTAVKGAPADRGKTQTLVDWIVTTLINYGAQDFATGMPSAAMLKQAKADIVYSSKATWERALKLAALQGVQPRRRGNDRRWIIGAVAGEEEPGAAE